MKDSSEINKMEVQLVSITVWHSYRSVRCFVLRIKRSIWKRKLYCL